MFAPTIQSAAIWNEIQLRTRKSDRAKDKKPVCAVQSSQRHRSSGALDPQSYQAVRVRIWLPAAIHEMNNWTRKDRWQATNLLVDLGKKKSRVCSHTYHIITTRKDIRVAAHEIMLPKTQWYALRGANTYLEMQFTWILLRHRRACSSPQVWLPAAHVWMLDLRAFENKREIPGRVCWLKPCFDCEQQK